MNDLLIPRRRQPSKRALLPLTEKLRACAYVRVSTTRQALHDISIPDQHDQIQKFCVARGWPLVALYTEPGASAMDDNRPEFQKMIDRASDNDAPFDVIVVHSYSRFFRDDLLMEFYVRRLEKHGVRVVSTSQELGEGPYSELIRRLIAIMDEMSSRENAKHVIRSMKRNAAEGFYNGSPVPLGYRTVAAEIRGEKVKKKLAIDEIEAEIVRMIFSLYRLASKESGPMGLKAITNLLNSMGMRTRRGAHFSVTGLHDILTNEMYCGTGYFNRRSAKDRTAKPASEHVSYPTPVIIPRTEFDAVQAILKSRSPRVESPRVVSGPILLTGLAKCAACDSAMTLRTGTSKSGKVHKYYSCSRHGRQGNAGCKGRSIPMDKLDPLVTNHLVEKLFAPDRLSLLLAECLNRQNANSASINQRMVALETNIANDKSRLNRLYRVIEDDDLGYDASIKQRILELRQNIERTKATLDRIRPVDFNKDSITPAAIVEFGQMMIKNITQGSIPFRKAYLQSVIDEIVVDQHSVRIVGSTATLENIIAGKSVPGVRSSVRKWRARHDSNV